MSGAENSMATQMRSWVSSTHSDVVLHLDWEHPNLARISVNGIDVALYFKDFCLTERPAVRLLFGREQSFQFNTEKLALDFVSNIVRAKWPHGFPTKGARP